MMECEKLIASLRKDLTKIINEEIFSEMNKTLYHEDQKRDFFIIRRFGKT